MSKETMKAAAFETPGPPEVLRLMTVPAPQAGPGQVRVRVKAAGVQPYDAAVRGGWQPPGAPKLSPGIPGNEFAGVVDQVGEGVDGFAVGDPVLGFTTLTAYAEYVVVPDDALARKPDAVPWEVAGALTSGVQTADIALENLAVGPGDTLLVHGAAGSVGTAAVQIARSRGARVIGTARAENHDYLRRLGAEPVEYGPGLADRVRALAPEGVSAALDGAGGAALEVSLDLVEDRGRILTLVEHAKAEELGIRVVAGERLSTRLAHYADLYAEGEFTFLVRRTYDLADAAQAHKEIETGHGQGKIAIIVP
ncbi:NADP-dependent oxidoreductase [Nonomuraea longicatena]|uniref:NADP-dependent oxidoreductase n=1 Tax=Nonomuraea longicatena TaxID=83682 RepID=A0ABN1NT86_9ACTN